MKTHILIITDDDIFRGYLQKLLKKSGYFVDKAVCFSEALQKMKYVLPDILVTDKIKPDMDGIELIRTVREKYIDVKIIAITGDSKIKTDRHPEMASNLKADCIMEKSFQSDLFLNSIKSICA